MRACSGQLLGRRVPALPACSPSPPTGLSEGLPTPLVRHRISVALQSLSCSDGQHVAPVVTPQTSDGSVSTSMSSAGWSMVFPDRDCDLSDVESSSTMDPEDYFAKLWDSPDACDTRENSRGSRINSTTKELPTWCDQDTDLQSEATLTPHVARTNTLPHEQLRKVTSTDALLHDQLQKATESAQRWLADTSRRSSNFSKIEPAPASHQWESHQESDLESTPTIGPEDLPGVYGTRGNLRGTGRCSRDQEDLDVQSKAMRRAISTDSLLHDQLQKATESAQRWVRNVSKGQSSHAETIERRALKLAEEAASRRTLLEELHNSKLEAVAARAIAAKRRSDSANDNELEQRFERARSMSERQAHKMSVREDIMLQKEAERLKSVEQARVLSEKRLLQAKQRQELRERTKRLRFQERQRLADERICQYQEQKKQVREIQRAIQAEVSTRLSQGKVRSEAIGGQLAIKCISTRVAHSQVAVAPDAKVKDTGKVVNADLNAHGRSQVMVTADAKNPADQDEKYAWTEDGSEVIANLGHAATLGNPQAGDTVTAKQRQLIRDAGRWAELLALGGVKEMSVQCAIACKSPKASFEPKARGFRWSDTADLDNDLLFH